MFHILIVNDYICTNSNENMEICPQTQSKLQSRFEEHSSFDYLDEKENIIHTTKQRPTAVRGQKARTTRQIHPARQTDHLSCAWRVNFSSKAYLWRNCLEKSPPPVSFLVPIVIRVSGLPESWPYFMQCLHFKRRDYNKPERGESASWCDRALPLRRDSDGWQPAEKQFNQGYVDACRPANVASWPRGDRHGHRRKQCRCVGGEANRWGLRQCYLHLHWWRMNMLNRDSFALVLLSLLCSWFRWVLSLSGSNIDFDY